MESTTASRGAVSPKAGAEGENSSRAPSVSLPKGGGAIRGIGEKFAANPATGTGSMTIPLAASPGRSGFGPQLSLSYDSGAGNGPFGFGWSLGLPQITRKTDKGLPRYDDDAESDVFILSGSEDLVPAGAASTRSVDGVAYRVRRYRPRVEGLFARIERWTDAASGETHWRSISRDNVTTLYGRDGNSRITDPADPDEAGPADPGSAPPPRIFSWLISQSYDDKGNAIDYRYKAEDSAGVDLTRACERNRTARARTANRYLKRIRYGNAAPLLAGGGAVSPLGFDGSATGWLFEAVFDYGEHDEADPHPDDDPANPAARSVPWPVRNDPFSSCRPGFEVRTYRLCQRVLMFHHIPDVAAAPARGVAPVEGYDGLARSTDLGYSDEGDPHAARDPIYSFLLSATQSGYKRRPGGGGLLKKSLPPVEFTYSEPAVEEEIREVDPESLENLPAGLDGSGYEWTDLHGEGAPGILNEQDGVWFYRRNLSPISPAGSRRTEARFGPAELVAVKPNLTLGGGARFMDLAGDGQLDLVVLDGPMPGLFEHDEEESWRAFRPFTSRLNLDLRDPNLKFVDLDGDGHADVLVSEDDALIWHPSLAEDGFGPARRVARPWDEEKGPDLVFADGTESIYLADLNGDGLTDLVRLRNGEVCYWPNLGYGRFGAKITMDGAPWFDHADQFDQRHIRLADIDGSGTADIIYLHPGGVRLYFNQSGNGWSPPRVLEVFPRIDDAVNVVAADLLGNGTVCLVWSSPLQSDARRPMRYVNLMGSRKPHLLVGMANNLGAETRVEYAPSTKFYLQDKRDGKPWVTRLPFPVHVVERVETLDHLGGNRFTTRYAYHHGYFDGEEREFRGFGMVEQWDTEELAALAASGALSASANLDGSSYVPPVHTRTWFHTGVYLERGRVADFFAGLLDDGSRGEYYREPGLSDLEAARLGLEGKARAAYDDARAAELLLDDTVLPTGLTLEEEREACRALKGAMLRQEIYALDGTARQEHPYTVAEQNFSVRLLQPRAGNRHAVFFCHPHEAITYHYERNPDDPRVQHALTLEVDAFGNVSKQAAVGYGRRRPDPALPPAGRAEQTRTLVTYTESRFTQDHDAGAAAIDADDDHRTPLPAETRTYEVTGLTLAPGAVRFGFEEVRTAGSGATPIPYEEDPASGQRQKRLIEHVRTLYRRNDLTGALPLGGVQSLALPFESYRLALTPGLAASIYGSRVTDAMLGGEAGYVHSEGDDGWWIPSGRTFYSAGSEDAPAAELAEARRHFFLPRRFRDPFHTADVSTESFTSYDAHDLLVLETRDALDNRVTAGERDAAGRVTLCGNDYRVLQPRLVMDPNRNRTAAAFDALGMVVGTAVMGKPSPAPAEGDSLAGFDADLADAVSLAHLANPPTVPAAILGRATTRLVYDLFAYQRTRVQPQPQPAAVYTLARETHDSEPVPAGGLKIQHSFSYSDGFGREIQKKVQAEPGPVPERGEDGTIITGADGQPQMTARDASQRWVGNGWTVFNNKGKPVRQYEPFFTDTHRYEFNVRTGVSPVIFYDPLGRVAATLHPDHTWEKTVFGPWRQQTWDAADTVLIVDPATDADAGDFFRRLPAADYLPTWHAQRQDGALGPQEQTAAEKSAVHAATPSVAHADSLGRTFLTVAHNRFEYTNAPSAESPREEFCATRTILDIEGNQREVHDALGRTVIRYRYDMLGSRTHQASMDAGQRWMLNDVAGKPLQAWDDRGHRFRFGYDALRRLTHSFLCETGGEELTVGRSSYGETRRNAETNNLRGKVYRVLDQAGLVVTDDYDLNGNLRRSRRRLAKAYKTTLDWSGKVPLERATYTARTEFDALNRPRKLVAPDGSTIHPEYNGANLLEGLRANLRGMLVGGRPAWTPLVTNIDYNAKGQRVRIDYGNRVRTTYDHDPLTSRLRRLETHKRVKDKPAGAAPPPRLQALRYTYDAAGNITRIGDAAQPMVYFRNRRVSAGADYTYDAIYRLIEATGREHLGQAGGASLPYSHDDAPQTGLPHPGDGNAMSRYLERYAYDLAGNFLAMDHYGSDLSVPGWKRTYRYDEPSLLEPDKRSNRLSSTTLGGGNPLTERYRYDAHGNVLQMPHLSVARWNFKDQLQATRRQAIDGADENGAASGGGTTWYVYDSGGQRVRKVTESETAGRPGPVRRRERIYLNGFEIYREYQGDTVVLERETLHVADGGQRLVLVETRTAGIDHSPKHLVRYQGGNHLGSVSLELDAEARIITYEEYTPYGSTSYQAVGKQTQTPKRYRYTGKERDEETGFSYHGARYYAPWLGRWAACDPSGLRDGTNVFAYVNDNPISKLDQTGNWEVNWKHVAIGAGVAALTVAAVALTAGAAAPVVVPAVASFLGVSEAAVVTTVAVAGTAAGVVGTANTAGEVATGRTASGATLTNEERSERLGALPVQVVATALGIRGLRGSPPTIPRPPAVALLNTPDGMVFPQLVPAASPITIPARPIGLSSSIPTIAMSMMSGDNTGGGGGGGKPEESGGGKTPAPDTSNVADEVRALPEEQQDRLLARIVRGDRKGRPFGTPRNPRLPTVEEFNPRVEELRAGDLEESVTGVKHGINPDQSGPIQQLSNDELIRFRLEDPISGVRDKGNISLTGGHHRTNEIINRVTSGKMSPDTKVPFFFHD